MSNVVDLDAFREKRESIGAHGKELLTVEEVEWRMESIAEQAFEQLASYAEEDYLTNPVYFSGEMFRQVIGHVAREIKRGNGGAVWLLHWMKSVTDGYIEKYDCPLPESEAEQLALSNNYFWHRPAED